MSAIVINTNIASLTAQQNLQATNAQLKISVQRLSSGYRVNSAADDAAGLARADQLKGQSRIIQSALRNINDGVSALEVADKSSEKITELLVRMGELASSAAQGTLDGTMRGYYSDEYNKLATEIERIAQTVEFGGSKLMNGSISSLTVFIGFKNSTNDQLSISMASLTIASTLNLATGQLSSITGALSGIDVVSAALKVVNDARAVYGATTNRLTTTLSNLQVTFTNFQAAESRIRDVDFAVETASFTKNQILIQSGVAVLSQANMLPQSVLSLLR